jgi:putative ABC transport system permease protein
MIDGLRHDVRYAVRTLRRSAFFTLLTVCTLGLGIGAITALFAVVNAVLWSPLVAEQDRVVRIWKHDVERGFARHSLSYQEFIAFREQARTLEAVGAIQYADASSIVVSVDARPSAVELAPVSSNFFEVLYRVHPLHGRWLESGDDFARDELAAVVSFDFWRRAAGGDPSLVGRRLPLAGGARAVVVVGIAPELFEYPLDTDMWVTIPAFFDGRDGRFDFRSRRLFHFELLGRLSPGVSRDQARAELDLLAQRLTAAFPDDYRRMPIVVEPLLDTVLGNGRQVLLFLFAAAGLVFLIAGVNVAALLLMRASDRRREMAVRIALGASRARLARQTITEGLLLAALSAASGIVLARLFLATLQLLAPGDMPRIERAAIDLPVAAFCALIALGWVIVLGTAPLWTPAREVAFSLKPARATRGLRVFTVVEIAAAVVVAIGAGLLVRTFVNLQGIDRGFRSANLAVVSLLLPEADYPDARARLAFFEDLLPRIRALPGVLNAAPVHLKPGTGTVGLSAPMIFEGQTREQAATNTWGSWEPTMPAFFETMGIPIVRGRAFTAADRADGAPVAIISESVARQYWPGQDPLGKRLQFISSMPQATVVGVAADVRYRELTKDWLTVYFPGSQFFFFAPSALVVRTAANAEALVPAIRDVVRQRGPHAAVQSVDTMDALLARELSRPRAALAVTTLFALIAIALAAVGVFGVLSYEMRQRQRELAVRSAIGASPAQIFRHVVLRSVAFGIIGAAAGVAVALGITGVMQALLYEVEPTDPLAFSAGAAVLLAIVLAASYLPAKRAATADPVTALRLE